MRLRRGREYVVRLTWALKDAKSKDVSQLVMQRKVDLKLLDDEYGEVAED